MTDKTLSAISTEAAELAHSQDRRMAEAGFSDVLKAAVQAAALSTAQFYMGEVLTMVLATARGSAEAKEAFAMSCRFGAELLDMAARADEVTDGGQN